MCQSSLSVWFVCKLCRGSFGQVDAFIEHKKQKHFTQFQNTTSIVFEERDLGQPYPVTTNWDHQLADESNEPGIKIEVKVEDPINPMNSEPNLDIVEVKSELITYESEINPDNENIFCGLKQPQQSPYVLLKRLTTDEIQRACVPQSHSTLLKCEQKNLINGSFDSYSKISDQNEAEKCTGTLPTATVRISTEDDLQFECKLCSKQLESEAQLKIHVGICALYHEDRNRFCVTCNRKFYNTYNLREHRLRFHGTEEEKPSLYKFKCHVCPKQYQRAQDLRFHLESHKITKEPVETSASKSLKCSQPNCGKEFRCNYELQRHISAVHLGVRPFSCSFPKCNKTFTTKPSMERHFLLHTGERPFKCNVDNCNKAFATSNCRLSHYRTVHLIF